MSSIRTTALLVATVAVLGLGAGCATSGVLRTADAVSAAPVTVPENLKASTHVYALEFDARHHLIRPEATIDVAEPFEDGAVPARPLPEPLPPPPTGPEAAPLR